jgi:hypothetical protein
MMSFRGGRLAGMTLPLGTVWLMTDVAEASLQKEGRVECTGMGSGATWRKRG